MIRHNRRFACICSVVLFLATGNFTAVAGDAPAKKPITFESVYGAGRSVGFHGHSGPRFTWLPDGEHFLRSEHGKSTKVQALTGKSGPYSNENKLSAVLSELPDVKSTGARELATLSPDGKFVCFVRRGDLYVADVATHTERRLTTDGGEPIRNGKADWVYWEEIFGRRSRAFWFSGDSQRIVFLRFDDTPVAKFTIADNQPVGQRVRQMRYPKAGTANPLVTLGIASLSDGVVRWIDLSGYEAADRLITRVGWLPDRETLYCYVQNRSQTWLDFNVIRPGNDKPERLFRETTGAWVDDPGKPSFLKDGSFLLMSERTGWRHIYRFSATGSNPAPVTNGDWEVRRIHYVDEQGGWVYFTGTKDSHLAENLYRVKLNGGDVERLTQTPGWHRISFSPKGNLFLDTSSSLKRPPQTTLHVAFGQQRRVVHQTGTSPLDQYRFGKRELVQIPARDGYELTGSLLKPADFDPQRIYPVWCSVYGGPHYSTVHDRYNRSHRMFDEVLAAKGIIVFRIDPRSASGKGGKSAWTVYRRLGVRELQDIEDAVGWLTGHDWIDGKRTGIGGHSYGGFLTAYAMTHSKLFTAGIAGAPVTDWRNYDTIYTERYMETPQNNPDGYDDSSVVRAAKNLHGRLLLLHGMLDDNVHVQNTTQLVHALQQADQNFEVMLYPRAKHSLHGRHYRRTMYDFILRELRCPSPPPGVE